MNNDGTAISACQRLINKMIGERTYSAQETAHLLLGIPLVHSTATFQTVVLDKDGEAREVITDESEPVEGNLDKNGDGRRVTGLSTLQK
jgi:hypothetical protein